MALALLEVGHAAPRPLPGARAPPTAIPPNTWASDYHILIPFLGPPGHVHHISYVDALRGNIPTAALRNKWVLVGATAQGLGDAYPTPRPGEGVAMPGIEIMANVLNALQTKHSIRPLGRGWAIGLSLLPLYLGGHPHRLY